MFKKAVIHRPDETAMKQINKELAAFRRAVTVKYVESLDLNDTQIEALFTAVLEDFSSKQPCA